MQALKLLNLKEKFVTPPFRPFFVIVDINHTIAGISKNPGETGKSITSTAPLHRPVHPPPGRLAIWFEVRVIVQAGHGHVTALYHGLHNLCSQNYVCVLPLRQGYKEG